MHSGTEINRRNAFMTDFGQPLLILQELTKTYDVSEAWFRPQIMRAVDELSLEVAAGEILGIVGESGSGKTTLAKMMLGMIKPSSGTVLFDGRAISSYSRREIARRVQFVFQDPFSSLNPHRSVADIVVQPLFIHGIGSAIDRDARVRKLLDLVGLPDRSATAFPRQLSGGQRQRVAIARALALNPELLICDEPTSALDVSVQAQILNLLADLRSEFGLTYVIVSHNLAVIEHLANRVAVMYLGRLVEVAPTERLFARPNHPYTQALLGSAMTIAPGSGVPPPLLRGSMPSLSSLPQGCRFHPRCPKAWDVCGAESPPRRQTQSAEFECHQPIES
jgi:peptide/nickel transport system ATP-binding protein